MSDHDGMAGAGSDDGDEQVPYVSEIKPVDTAEEISPYQLLGSDAYTTDKNMDFRYTQNPYVEPEPESAPKDLSVAASADSSTEPVVSVPPTTPEVVTTPESPAVVTTPTLGTRATPPPPAKSVSPVIVEKDNGGTAPSGPSTPAS